MTLFILFSFITPYFRVETIAITRSDVAFDMEPLQTKLATFQGKNMLFLDPNEIITTVLSEFAQVSNVSINEAWPREIQVELTLHAPAFLVMIEKNEAQWLMSASGVILRRAKEEILPNLTLRQYDTTISDGDILFLEEEMNILKNIESTIETQFPLLVDDLYLMYAARELHIVANGGQATLWLDMTTPIEPQLKKLATATEQINLEEQSFEHIDLRIPGRIFWQRKR